MYIVSRESYNLIGFLKCYANKTCIYIIFVTGILYRIVALYIEKYLLYYDIMLYYFYYCICNL